MPGYLRGVPKVIHNITEGVSGEFLWNGQEISGSGGTLDQGIGLSDAIYLYVIYGIDGNWIVIRDTKDLVTRTSTGTQGGIKPTTLVEVQVLIYN